MESPRPGPWRAPSAYIECPMQTASQRHWRGGELCAAATPARFTALNQKARGSLGAGPIEAVERMQRAHGELGKGGVNQKRKLDLRGSNGADIDGALGQGAEGFRRHAGMAAHADADNRNLGDIGGAVEALEADRFLRLGDH